MADRNKVGLVFAALLGSWHVLWAALVAIGWAQPILNFIFWTHMLKPIYLVAGFDPAAAATLVLVTAFVGYVFGYVGAWIWNRLHRQAS